jgi:hypothetical protein
MDKKTPVKVIEEDEGLPEETKRILKALHVKMSENLTPAQFSAQFDHPLFDGYYKTHAKPKYDNK